MRNTFALWLLLLMLFVLPHHVNSQHGVEREFIAPGYVEGYVFNYYGLAVSNAVVGLGSGPITTSGPDGYYFLDGVIAGEQNIGCGKTGYNPSWILVPVVSGDTVEQDFNLTQPSMVINPLTINANINPGEYFTTTLNILNNGTGPLTWQAEITYQTMPLITCDYSIALYDTWGDGWTGCSVDVMVNGLVVLDNITLSNGAGPEYFYFPVLDGDVVTTVFSPGTFITEPYYYIFNTEGEQVWFSPAGSSGPPDILPGQLYSSCSAGQWLSLGFIQGEVPPFGGVDNVPTYIDAYGTNSGESFNADITFTSSPFIGAISIPVTMNVQGNELEIPENLFVELVDEVNGEVDLSWDWTNEAFQFFLIKRNGQIIATTSQLYYTDILPGHGFFCYTVQAVYSEGLSSPEGPECIEWPDPVLIVDPLELQGSVWTGFTIDVFTTLFNLGEGTLAFSFPEFAALNLINDPQIEQNQTGPQVEPLDNDLDKGDESHNGKGYPVVLGAGGPDAYGYVWIDSDEPGGPNFTYTDISTTGNPIFGLSDDNIVGPYNIGFDFYFYGESKQEFWVNSNGCIGFTSNYITIQNTTIPTNSSVYNDFIAWMWDDLVFKTGSSQAFYQIVDNKLIIQFKNYEYIYQPGLHINAEVVLYENGKVLVLYDDFSPGVTLNSCTVGMQSSDPSTGLQVVYNSAYLHNDLAILISHPADFISDVTPAYGTIQEGDSAVITITYDAQDYDPGLYTNDLLLESNDINNMDLRIGNTMQVYLPAIFSGVVFDRDDDEPINGVLVTAGPFQAITGEDGAFTLHVDEGYYDVGFEKLGYKPVNVRDTAAWQNNPSVINIGLWDMNYAPGLVHAEVMDNDTWCEISWSLPQGPYEIILDDGEADDFFVFAHSGSWNAVKFTPSGYPSTVIGGQFYVGDGSFPGPFLGTEFGVAVFDDDGFNGLPGTMLDSSGVTVNNSGWVNMDWLHAEISEGSFYLAMYQSGNSPHAAPIGYDTDNPTYFRSYTKFLNNDWSLSPLQDFMIRAWINGPENNEMRMDAGKIKQLNPGERNVASFVVARYANFDPYGPPTAGTISELTSTNDLTYDDNEWGELPMGWYAYGVKALYTSGLYSDYTVSNLAPHLMDFQVGITVTLSDGLAPDDVQIKLKGPFTDIDTIVSSGSIIFDLVWRGHFDIRAFKVGYDVYSIMNTSITGDKVFNIMLSEKKYSPTCLYVDPVSLLATWCRPLITALNEDFEGQVFPPAGWQVRTDDEMEGWIRTGFPADSNFSIPPWDSYYAISNVNISGSGNNGCCDYLITPPVDLRESDGYSLSFDSFYNGAFGGLAFIEYSIDGGNTWEVLDQMLPDQRWSKKEISLSTFSGMQGPSQIWFAFLYNNGGDNTTHWAIDNVKIQVPDPAANSIDYWVFLDNVFIGTTTNDYWDFAPLPYGQTYTVSVAARYSSGLSSKDYYTFTSNYLFPPQNLTVSAPDDAAILSWDPPGTSVPANLLGYNLYRSDVLIGYLVHTGSWVPQAYVEEDLQPGIYPYTVTGVYDLEPYGFPDETGESMIEGPAVVMVDYCNELEFVETWDIGNLENNRWVSDGPNWAVNIMAGNPSPVVEFSGDPAQTDYVMSLESYPLCAYGLTEGTIWLDYDLSLGSITATGDEKLTVQVWGWDAQEWNDVAVYDNSGGTFDWISERLNIRQYALNRIFKVRFRASGSNSANLRSWFIDNVHIYRSCTAPTELEIDPAHSEGIRLTWQLGDYSSVDGGEDTRELTGCKIHRSIDGGAYETLPGLAYGNEFIDPDSGLVFGSSYCYKVSAVWESATDLCESPFSNIACVIFTATPENQLVSKPGFELFPNPADDYVMISATERLKQIQVFNSLGLQIDHIVDNMDNAFRLNTAGYSSGVYLVKAMTDDGISVRLLTIRR